eukprot:4764789-Pyramimonas_sp.AAC.1
MLCDANAHVGSDASSTIGPEGHRDDQHVLGGILHSTLMYMQHVATNTIKSDEDTQTHFTYVH